MNYIYDTIIVGAGLSGLVAAQTILDKDSNLDVLVLEAKDRVGGRILSGRVKVKYNKYEDFDLGAHWVSSTQNHLIKYVNFLNLNLVAQNTGTAIGFLNNYMYHYDFHPVLGNFFVNYEIKNFFASLEELSRTNKFSMIQNKLFSNFYNSITMENYINSKLYLNTSKAIIQNIIQTTCGVQPSEISVIYYILVCNSCLGFTNNYMTADGGAREFWIKEGASEICNRLQNKIGDDNFLFNEPVVSINFSEKQEIQVTTSSGKIFSCTHLVCAIPSEQVLNVLFEPRLPNSRIEALQNIRSGHVIKFVVTYNEAFWIKQGFSGEIFLCNGNPHIICYDASKNNNPALTGYIKYFKDDIPHSITSHKDMILNQLTNFWGKDALNPIDYLEKNWFNEPFVGGCPMSCIGLNTIRQYCSLFQPIGRIQFACSEIATEWNGHMDGAIQSGYRAAINVLYELRPQLLTYEDFTCIESKRRSKVRFTKTSLVNKYTITLGIVVAWFIVKVCLKNIYIPKPISLTE